MPQSGLTVKGEIEIVASDASGIRQRVRTRNHIVNGGLVALANLLKQGTGVDTSDFQLATLKVGTGTRDVSNADTALADLSPYSASVTVTGPDATDAGIQLTVSAEFTDVDPNRDLSEAGLFLADDTLFARQKHTVIRTQAGLTLTYTWRITLKAAA